jgi:hypothetical protein
LIAMGVVAAGSASMTPRDSASSTAIN